MTYSASCHCGAVSVVMQRKARQLTQCNCSLCRRYGALWAYFQRKSIRVKNEENTLQCYLWKNQRIEFFHCTHCGCVTHYEYTAKREDGSDMAAVNMRNIDDPGLIAQLPIRLLDGAKTWKVIDKKTCPYLLCSPATDLR